MTATMDLRAAGFGILSVALTASSIPRRPLEEHQVAAYAEQGLERLGGLERAREVHQRLLELNASYVAGEITPDVYRAEVAAVWPEQARFAPRRWDHCIGLAYRLSAGSGRL